MKVINYLRVLASVFFIVITLLAVGCTADGQQADVEAPSTSSSPPEAEVSPETLSAVECLRDRGWEITEVSGEGWLAPGVTEAQSGAYSADTAECTSLNTTIEPLEEISEERWEQGYAGAVASAECLRGEGYDIPETPTFQSWRDSFFSDASGADQWIPWLFVPTASMNRSDMEALEAVCPQSQVTL